jgi:hypothetical protein
MLRYRVRMLVSGRMGWNGRYWITAAGLHQPCPGGDYQDQAPEELSACGAGTSDSPAAGGAARVSDALAGLEATPTPGAAGPLPSDMVPAVVASSAGGKLADEGGAASDGYWRGYTVVRLDSSGDVRKTIVEQRPIFDWVSVTASAHALRPGQPLTVHAEGREAVGMDQPMRYDEIASPAITHRFTLIEADPARPWLPKVVEGNGEPHGYVSLDPTVATIDQQTGLVRSGRSSHGRVYGLAVISVGSKAASWPLVFEPKRSYVAPPQQRLTTPVVSTIRVLSSTAASFSVPSAPGATPPPPPITSNLSLPTPPTLPSFPASTPTAVPPPPPPAPPPPPPSGHQGLPLSLNVTPVGVSVPPTTGVTAQPTPPVNPSPPSGARKEAKQRQAATAKSEEGGDAGAAHGRSDLAEAPHSNPGASMTRVDSRDQGRHAYTRLEVTGGGGGGSGFIIGSTTVLAALSLSMAMIAVRPRRRRRDGGLGAPAWNRWSR